MDIYCYNALAGACSRDAWLAALWSLCAAAADGLRPDGVSLNVAASAYEKRGLWRSALASMGLSTLARNAAMTAAQAGTQWRHGLSLLEDLGRVTAPSRAGHGIFQRAAQRCVKLRIGLGPGLGSMTASPGL